MGANMIMLRATGGTVTARVSSRSQFTATLVGYGPQGGRYAELANGCWFIAMRSGEEVALVVANTPSPLTYDPFRLPAAAQQGMEYEVQVQGASTYAVQRI